LEKLAIFFRQIIVCSVISLIFIVIIPGDPDNTGFLGFSPYRLLMVAFFLFFIAASLFIFISLKVKNCTGRALNHLLLQAEKSKLISSMSFLLLHLFVFLGIVFVALWLVFRNYSLYFIRLAPFFFLITAVGAQGLWLLKSKYPVRFAELRNETYRIGFLAQKCNVDKFLLVFSVLIFGSIYVYWGITHAILVNQNPMLSDQHSYLSIAKQAHDTNFQYLGDRNRMPIYPFLLALFYRNDVNTSEFFELGKVFNVYLSIILLLGLYLVLKRSFPGIHAFLVTFISAFCLFIYKSGYVQPELLYYFMSFISYLMMLKMIARPRVKWGIATGSVLGFTYLIKASVLPGFVLFLAIFLIKQLLGGWDFQSPGLKQRLIVLARKIFPILIVVFTFILVLMPYLSENKKVFGHYFYNVNTTFYVWYDNWDQVMSGTKAHGDGVGWPDLPDEEIPNMQKYIKEHTFQQMIDRFAAGAKSQYKNMVDPYSYFNYPFIYSILLVIAIIVNFRKSLVFAQKYVYQILFFVLFIGTNLVLYAWYSPIANHFDARFIYGLYIPYLYSVYWFIYHSAKEFPDKMEQRQPRTLPEFIRINLLTIANPVLIGLLIVEIVRHIPVEMTTGWFAK